MYKFVFLFVFGIVCTFFPEKLKDYMIKHPSKYEDEYMYVKRPPGDEMIVIISVVDVVALLAAILMGLIIFHIWKT